MEWRASCSIERESNKRGKDPFIQYHRDSKYVRSSKAAAAAAGKRGKTGALCSRSSKVRYQLNFPAKLSD